MYHFIPAHFSPPDLAHFSPLNCIVSSTQRAHFSPPNSTHFIPNGNFSIAKKHQKMKSESEFECARPARAYSSWWRRSKLQLCSGLYSWMTFSSCLLEVIGAEVAPTICCHLVRKTSQELRMLSSVTINCQVTKIVMNSGSQLSVL